MGWSKTQLLLIEKSRVISRALYQAVDSCRGERLDRESQDELISALISEHNLDLTPTAYRRHMACRLRHRKNRKHAWEDFWRLGLDFFEDQHLIDIGLRPRVEAGASTAEVHDLASDDGIAPPRSPEASNITAGVVPAQGQSKPLFEEVEDPESESSSTSQPQQKRAARANSRDPDIQGHGQPSAVSRPAKTTTATTPGHNPPHFLTTDKGGPKTTKSSASTLAPTELPQGRRKRHIDYTEISDSGDELSPERERAQKRPHLSDNIEGGTHQNKTSGRAKSRTHLDGPEHASRPVTAIQQSVQTSSGGVNKAVTALAKAADDIRDGDRTPDFFALDIGLSKVPLQDARASFSETQRQRKEGASTAESTHTDIFPPELPVPGAPNTSDRRYIYNRVLSAITSTMRDLRTTSGSIFVNFTGENKLDHRGPAHIVRDPSPELAALYARVFASEEWYNTFIKRINQKEAWPLDAQDVVSSLIAAAVYQDVFCAQQPWDIATDIKAALGNKIKYLEQAVDDNGYELNGVVQQALYKMVNDERFQESTIEPHARLLTAKLADTLSPHLRLFRDLQKPTETSRAGADEQPKLGSWWLEMLEGVYTDALIVKGKIDSYYEAQYEYVWPDSGTMMDSEMCSPMCRLGGPEKRIMLTFWPAIKVTRKRYDTGMNDTWYASQAPVLTTTNLG